MADRHEKEQGSKAGKTKGCRTTVVIPNYNGIAYLEECLASVCAGTVVPRIILVDNASSDESLTKAKEKFPQIRTICLSENTGFSHAVNVGIQEADTEFVFLLNNDTRIEKSCVEELEKAMDASEKIFSASAKMINMRFPEKIDDAGDFYCLLGWALARGKDKPVSRYQKSGRIFSSCAGAAMYRRRLFDSVGLFDEEHFAYLEDVDIGYRSNRLGCRNVFAPEAAVLHAGSAVSGSRHNAFKVRLSSRNSVYLIYKNMPFLQLLLNLPFLLLGFAVKALFFAAKGLGGVYGKGLMEGLRLSFSKRGRKHKVKFAFRQIPALLWIEWQMLLSFLYFWQ